MKIKKLFIFLTLILLTSFAFAQNDTNKINIYLFWGEGCPHCEGEINYLTKISENQQDLNIVFLELTKNQNNTELLIKISEKLNINVEGIPFTVIGDKYIKGWLNEETTGKQIQQIIDYYRENKKIDLFLELNKNPSIQPESIKKIILPFFGEIELQNISLPLLTIMIAFLDGFNPCAMWILLFLISLLLGIKDKKKRWIFGITFIFASALVYFLFMVAWLNIFIFLGFILWVRILIGIVAIGAGAYNLNDYLTNKDGGCKVTGSKKRQEVFDKLKKIIQEKSFLIAILGLIALAFAVNLVELICSAGLPAIYTQILTLSNLSTLEYYGFLSLYILIFMLDDLIVFLLAMKTLELSGLSTKYSRYSHLIGGALMILIGIILILKPELLMFG